MISLHDLLSGCRGLILLCIFDFGARVVSGAPATSEVIGIEIGDGQIQVPASPQSATSLYKAIETITTPFQNTSAMTTQLSSTTTSTKPHTSDQRYALLESAIFYVAHESRPTIHPPVSSQNLSLSSTAARVSSSLADISSKHALTPTVSLQSAMSDFPNPRKTTLVTPSSISSVPTLHALACTKFLFFPDDGPNSFVCQCNNGTWNHRKAQESYSDCPSQVTSTALTTITSTVVLPSTVSCNLIVFGPGSPTWGPPFCECSNDLLFLGSCPISVSARTTTLTLSEPVTPGANAIPTFTTDLSAAVCTEVPSLSIKCVAPPPVVIPPPSPTTAACTPRCTKSSRAGPYDDEQAYCHCNPACGGYPYPSLNGDGECPYQVN